MVPMGRPSSSDCVHGHGRGKVKIRTTTAKTTTAAAIYTPQCNRLALLWLFSVYDDRIQTRIWCSLATSRERNANIG